LRDVGTFFTFNKKSKALRLAKLAQKRVTELKTASREGEIAENIRSTQQVANRYKKQLRQAIDTAQQLSDKDKATVWKKISQETNQNLVALKNVADQAKVPAKVKQMITQLNGQTQQQQQQVLKKLADFEPQEATNITLEALTQQVQRVKEKANQIAQPDKQEEILSDIEEYKSLLKDVTKDKEGVPKILSKKLDKIITNLEEVEGASEDLKNGERVEQQVNNLIDGFVSNHVQALQKFSEQDPGETGVLSSNIIGKRIEHLNEKMEKATNTQCTNLSEEVQNKIDAWIEENDNLNRYGDSQQTMYAGGTPLFDESTGKQINRYCYILGNHPQWHQKIRKQFSTTPAALEQQARFQQEVQRIEKYTNLSSRISKVAQQLPDDDKLQQLVKESTGHHLEALQKVYEKVATSSKEALQQAMINAEKGHQRAMQSLQTKKQAGPEEEPDSQQGPSEKAKPSFLQGIKEQVQQEMQLERKGQKQQQATSSE